MMYAISIVLGLFIFIFDMFKIPCLILLIIIALYITIKEIKNKKYSRNIFKNTKAMTEIDYTIMEINQIKGYKKIIKKDSSIIAILEKGIFFMKVLNYTDKIVGDINDEYFDHIIGIKKYKKQNEIKNYDNEYSKYQNKIKENINKYIIIRNDCTFNIKNLKNTKVINNKNLFYTLDRETKKYNREQINQIFDKLNM